MTQIFDLASVAYAVSAIKSPFQVILKGAFYYTVVFTASEPFNNASLLSGTK